MAPPGPSYSPAAVDEALGMAAAALAAKNAALEDLQERLCLASLQLEQLGKQHADHLAGDAAGGADSAGPPPTAADSTEQPPAAATEAATLRQRLAAAEARLAAERQQRLAAKTQLEVVKGQLADALAAQVGAGLGAVWVLARAPHALSGMADGWQAVWLHGRAASLAGAATSQCADVPLVLRCFFCPPAGPCGGGPRGGGVRGGRAAR